MSGQKTPEEAFREKHPEIGIPSSFFKLVGISKKGKDITVSLKASPVLDKKKLFGLMDELCKEHGIEAMTLYGLIQKYFGIAMSEEWFHFGNPIEETDELVIRKEEKKK